jgi:hypothetical protein
MAYNFFPDSISCHEKGLRCLYQSEKQMFANVQV